MGYRVLTSSGDRVIHTVHPWEKTSKTKPETMGLALDNRWQIF